MTIQNWIKQGQIYTTRAQVPTVFKKSEKIWRIFFADRLGNRSFIRYIDVEAGNPKNILFEQKESVLPWGELGTFDYSGVMPSWIVEHPTREQVWMYYIGWTQRKDVPYQNSIGLAISYDGGETFKKARPLNGGPPGPVLGTDINEPFFTGTSCVEYFNGMFRLWYMSAVGWTDTNPPEPMYDIKYRVSPDGETHWSDPLGVIKLKDDEGGIVRASVLLTVDHPPGLVKKTRMWYSYRKKTDFRTNPDNAYRIGYAEVANDLLPWVRRDDCVNLAKGSAGEWDSMMQCYPHVITHGDELFMFYNGNTFGETGIGYATLLTTVDSIVK